MYTTSRQNGKMNSRKAIFYTLLIHASLVAGVALCFTPKAAPLDTPTENIVTTATPDQNPYFQEKISKAKKALER